LPVVSTVEDQRWPGQRLGLPEEGPGSVAGWGRRLLALCVDWLLSMLAVGAFVGGRVWSGEGFASWGPLAIFLVEVWLLTGLLGASAGQRICGLAVVRVDRRPVGLLPSLVRTLLIALVIPAVIYDRDQRGLHDLAAGTVVVRR
jgi:uncharacterized RDD family membrane protein YckC